MRRKGRNAGSGRNPITPDEILAAYPPLVRATAQALRETVTRMVPLAEERPYPVWRGIGYHHPKAGYFCGIFPRRDDVKLGFEWGVLLDDPTAFSMEVAAGSDTCS